MKIVDIGVIIAEREIDGYMDDKPCKVVVKIGKPFIEEADGSCWYCPYSINAPGMIVNFMVWVSILCKP